MNENPSTGSTRIWVKEIKEDSKVSGCYLSKLKRLAYTKKGDPFLTLVLSDRTGEVEARVWERAEEFSAVFKEGDILDVEGYANSYRNRVQLTLTGLKPAAGAVDPGLFLESSPRNIPEMMRSLREALMGIGHPMLLSLVERFLSDRSFTSVFKTAPAAKHFHHGYLGGLLEHTLSVCRMAATVADHYPELDRDLLLAGAFLHDIGKIREYKYNCHIDYTDEGRLLGHPVLGIAMLDEKLATIKDFPQELAVKLKHLILSHHGEYEFGSPKRPKFLEAFALHLIDDLDAKINGLSRFMERDRQDGAWTDFNRLFERYFLKGKIMEDEDRQDPGPLEDTRQGALFSSNSSGTNI